MKRQISELNDDISESTGEKKRLKVDGGYHAASKVHNYMLNDPILDWLDFKSKYSQNYNEDSSSHGIFNRTRQSKKNKKSKNLEERSERSEKSEKFENITKYKKFEDYITEKGREFETSVVELLKTKLEILSDKNSKRKKTCKFDFVTIARNKEDIASQSKYQETILEMEKQVAIIYQGVLHGNNDFRAYGSPDLLIRSDIVSELFDTPIDKIEHKSNNKFYYIVVDIKFCTLKLKVDGKFICNSGRTPAFKGQIMIYNELLGIAQGYTPEYCYILGRGWKYSQKGINYECLRCDERLGAIDCYGKDSFYRDKIKKALEWLDNVKGCGNYWHTNPPSVPELYPNMCNKYDNNNRTKKVIASEIDEITQLWYAGVKHREKAHAHGIYKLTDPNLTTEILGFPNGTKRTMIIDKMLKFNQGIIGKDRLVIPRYIDENPFDWQKPAKVEFFIDFEFFSSIFDSFEHIPNMGGPTTEYSEDIKDIVFMVGLGVSIRSLNKVTWDYYNFRVPKLDNQYEFEIFDQMFNKMHDISKKYRTRLENNNVYHWGSIERTILNKVSEKYSDKHDWPDLCLVDFNKIVQEEPILIKGVYGFGLKAFGKGLIKHKLINTDDWDSDLGDGLDVMIQAFSIYECPDTDHEEIVNKIIKYNHIDVKMIMKILNYLRNNHVRNNELRFEIVFDL